jgi:hypothetical protein
MADETQYNNGGEQLNANGLPEGSASVTGGYDGAEVGQGSVPASNAAPQDVVVKGTPVEANKVPEHLDFASSRIPYHTATTEKIARERAEALKDEPVKEYHYEMNGYVVEEVKGPNPQATKVEDANKLWKVTQGDFVQYFNNQRAAEIFANTHSPQFAANSTVKSAPAVQDIPKT